MHSDNKNSILLGLQYATALVLSLVGLKLNLLTYGEKAFDVWLILLSLWGVGQALDFGFGVSIVKFIALSNNDNSRQNKIVSTGFCLYSALGFFIVIAGIVTGELIFFSNPKLIPPHQATMARYVLYLLGINFFCQYLSNYFRAVFEGKNDFFNPVKLSFLFSVLLFIQIFIVYILKLSMIWLGIAYMVSSLVQCICFIFVLFFKYKSLKLRFSSASIKIFKEMFSFSFSIQIVTILGAMIDPVIKYIIGNYSGKGMISIYEVARRLTLALSALFSQAFRNYLPKISILKNREDYLSYLNSDGKKITQLGISYSGVMFGVFSFIFIVIIKFYYGFNESVILFFILALTESVNNTAYNLYVFVIGTGKSVFLIFQQLTNLIFVTVFLIVGLALLKSSLGFMGCFFSVLLTNSILLYYIKRISGLKLLQFLKDIKIYKLALLHIFIFINIALLINISDKWIYIESAFCLAVFLVFASDLLKIIEMGKQMIGLKLKSV